MTVPWKASDALHEAGVDHAVAIEAFIRRVEAGQSGSTGTASSWPMR